MTKLKPCPFCGAPDPEVGGNFIECRTCHGSSFVGDGVDKAAAAIRLWNARAALTKINQSEINDALKAAAKALDESAATIRARIN